MDVARMPHAEPQQCTGCGCTDAQSCPGGCTWVAPNVCSRCADQAGEALGDVIGLELPLAVVFGVAYHLRVALRTPDTGPTRPLVEAFLEQCDGILLESGFLSEPQLAAARQQAADAGPRIVLPGSW